MWYVRCCGFYPVSPHVACEDFLFASLAHITLVVSLASVFIMALTKTNLFDSVRASPNPHSIIIVGTHVSMCRILTLASHILLAASPEQLPPLG